MPVLVRLQNTRDPWRMLSEHWIIMVLNQPLQSILHPENPCNGNKITRFGTVFSLFVLDIAKDDQELQDPVCSKPWGSMSFSASKGTNRES